MQRKGDIKAYIFLSFSVLFWGTSYVGTKIALTNFPPLTLAFLLFFIASTVFLAFLTLRGWPKLPDNFHKKMMLISLFLPGLYFICENYGVKYTTATKASLIAATIPVAVLLLSIFFLKERISVKRILSLFLSLVGVTLLICIEQDQSTLFSVSKGDVLMLGAVFAAAGYMILARHFSNEIDPVLITAFQMLYGALFFSPFFLLQVTEVQWVAVESSSWIALFVLAMFSSVGAFVTYNSALCYIPASRASIFINIVPFITIFAAWWLLDERLRIIQFAGGMIVIFAAYLAQISGKDSMQIASRSHSD